MTEAVPVAKILGPASKGNTDYQSTSQQDINTLKDQGLEASSNRRSEGDQTADNNKESMARISWTCFRTSWFVYDGLGITCAGVTYGLIVYALFVVIGVILLTEFPSSPWAYIHSILFTLLAVLAISAHARSMTTDPVSVIS